MWNTLSWSQEKQQFQLSSDGYFTDTQEITVEENRALTLALRGRRFVDHNSLYESSYLYYDQVRGVGRGAAPPDHSPGVSPPNLQCL